jgi:branched-chain amino acid transport system substrate-binding protein
LTALEGRESFKGASLAVDEINARGGVPIGGKMLPIQIEQVDLQDASPKVRVADAVRDLEQFILSKNLNAIVVGPFRSEVLLSGMDMIARHKVPLLGSIAMSPASDAKIMRNPKYRYIFRLCLNSKYLADYLINTMNFLHERFQFDKVYIMNQDVAWARTTTSLVIRLFFERAGWDILGLDVYPSGASDFSSSLKKARAKGAQVILPIFDMPQSGALVKQWNTMRVPSLLCGFISPMVGPGAWKAFDGKIANALNVVFELGNVPSAKYPPAGDFYEAYKKKYGGEIEAGHGPAPAYESVYVLAEAIERAGSLDPDDVVRAIEKTDRCGVMGRIRFHKGHQVIFGKDPAREALACVVQWTTDGKRKIVYPPSIAEGEIELPAFFR